MIDGRIQSAQSDDDDLRPGIAPSVNAGAAVSAKISMVDWFVLIFPQNILSLRNPEASARNASDRLESRARRLPADRAMAKHDRPQRFVNLILDLSAKTTASVHEKFLPVRNATC